jgi:hypothetical protein
MKLNPASVFSLSGAALTLLQQLLLLDDMPSPYLHHSAKNHLSFQFSTQIMGLTHQHVFSPLTLRHSRNSISLNPGP